MKTIRCPQCAGAGRVPLTPDGRLWAECEVCDGERTVDVPTCQEDLDYLGIPADAADLIGDDDDRGPSGA